MTRLGYFVTESSEHFAEYVALVHQARPPRPDREVRHPARRIPAALHREHREVEEPGAGVPRRRDHRGQGQPRVRLGDHQLGLDRHAVGDLRQRPEPRPDHLAPRGLRRRGALPRRPQRHPADPRRQAAATARRADAHQHQRAGADRRGAASRRTPSTSTTPRCSTRTPPPSSTSTRSGSSPTSSSPATATGCPHGRGPRARARRRSDPAALRRRRRRHRRLADRADPAGELPAGGAAGGDQRRRILEAPDHRRRRGLDRGLPPDAAPARLRRARVPARDRRHDQVRHPPQGLAAGRLHLRRSDRRPAPGGRRPRLRRPLPLARRLLRRRRPPGGGEAPLPAPD